MKDAMITAARTKECVIPGNRANSPIMTLQSLQYFGFGSIPYLQVSRVSSNSELIAVAGPLNTGNSIVWPDVTQFCDFTIWRWPEVDAWAQSYSKDVLLRPVNEV